MLKSRKLQETQSRDSPDHSTTLQDLRDRMRIKNSLHKSQKSGGGFQSTMSRLGKAMNNMNKSMAKQSSKMPTILK
jgi:hypothetical protein